MSLCSNIICTVHNWVHIFSTYFEMKTCVPIVKKIMFWTSKSSFMLKPACVCGFHRPDSDCFYEIKHIHLSFLIIIIINNNKILWLHNSDMHSNLKKKLTEIFLWHVAVFSFFLNPTKWKVTKCLFQSCKNIRVMSSLGWNIHHSINAFV